MKHSLLQTPGSFPARPAAAPGPTLGPPRDSNTASTSPSVTPGYGAFFTTSDILGILKHPPLFSFFHNIKKHPRTK